MDEAAVLVGRAAGGDEQAFGELVKRHYRAVFGVALATLGRADAAEDVAQEAFVLAWRHLDRLRSPGAFPVWIRTIARNLSKNWIRSKRTRDTLAERYRASLGEEAPAAAVERLRDRERAETVWRALDALPARLREALALYYLEGENVAGTAKALGITAEAVRVRLYQGRKRLRAHYEAELRDALAPEGEAASPERARRRILAGLAAGPALPELARVVPTHVLPLVAREVILGGLAVKTKLAAGGAVAVLVLAAALVGVPRVLGRVAAPETPVLHAEVDRGEAPAAVDAASAGERATAVGAEGAAAGNDAPAAGSTVDSADVLSASGTVTDEGAAPVAGAEVFALTVAMAESLDADPNEPLPRVDRQARTDAKGFFRLDGLDRQKKWKIIVQARGYEPASYEIYARDGAESYSNVVLRPGVTLEGRVVSAGNRPVPGALIWSWGIFVSENGAHRISSSVQTTALADPEGRFLLSLKERAKTHLYVACAEGRALFEDVEVGGGEPVILRMPAASDCGTLYGRVRTPAGEPVAGVAVRASRNIRLEDGIGGYTQGEYFCAAARVSGDDGRYELAGLPVGVPLELSVVREDVTVAEANLPSLLAGERRLHDVVLEAPAVLQIRLTGTVTAKPFKGTRIEVRSDERTVREAVTDAEGRVRVELFEPGDYLVCPAYKGSMPNNDSIGFARPARAALGVTTDVELQLPDAFTLSARLVDENGAPVASPQVTAWWSDTRTGKYGLPVRADAQGRATCEDFPPGKRGWFEFNVDGFPTAESPEHLGQPGEVFPEDVVVLLRSSGVAGRLLGPDGKPVPGVSNVTVYAQNALASPRTFTTMVAPDGAFRAEGMVPAGTVTVGLVAESAERVSLGDSGETAPKKVHIWYGEDVECRPGEVADMGSLVYTEMTLEELLALVQ